jgi:malonate-semialdehyde dehydrogenase (acetylating)/methylmalonate-semialdehyde dehydrogenase
MKRIGHFVGGAVHEGKGDRMGPVFCPATGEQIAEVSLAEAQEVDEVVAIARAAFESWRHSPLSRRVEVLEALHSLLVSHRNELAQLVTLESGKLLSDAAGEVGRGLENVEFAIGIPSHLQGAFSEQVSEGMDTYSLRQPVGVVAAITPANFPVMVPLWMLPNAVACGNTVVLKPSEKDPSAPMRLAELFQEAGVPDGVVNVVNGDQRTVEALLAHPQVDAVSFVGSTPVARSVYQTGTKAGKRVQALGGAKNHLIVLPDADLDAAAAAAVSAGYGAAGERCMAVSVVVPVSGVGSELVPVIQRRATKVVVGDPTDPASELGPLITEAHRDRVTSFVVRAPEEGATVLLDGQRHGQQRGFYLGPSLLDNVTPNAGAYQEEIFGPVLVVIAFDDDDDAVRIANNSIYGLAGAVFSRDQDRALAVARRIRTGSFSINGGNYFSPDSPFGGFKQSGVGREMGVAGLEEFLEHKTFAAPAAPKAAG